MSGQPSALGMSAPSAVLVALHNAIGSKVVCAGAGQHMPPRRVREYYARQAQSSDSLEIAAKRNKRRLAELESSNYEEGNYSKGRARALISEKRNSNIPGLKKNKSSMNVRSALLYRKIFAALLEEARLRDDNSSYLSAEAPRAKYPARHICSVCGYWGAYEVRLCVVEINRNSVSTSMRRLLILVSLFHLSLSDLVPVQVAPAQAHLPAFDDIPFLIAPPSSSLKTSNPPLMMAYYPDWCGSEFPPEKIDFARYDWIDFAFALPDKNGNLGWDDPSSAPQLLTRLVNATHSRGKKVKLSIGGWTGSQYFSTVMSNANIRGRFVKNIVKLCALYQLDGVDIDWEYPGHQGEGDNVVSPSDSNNFLLFLQALRKSLPGAKLSAAVLPTPFFGTDGKPMQDVSAYCQILDWVTIMNYDVWGSSSKPGPNAPLSDRCKNSTQPEASAYAAYAAWTKAKCAAQKLVLGVPSYAYLSKSSATRLRGRSNSVTLSSDGDQIQFRELLEQKALVRMNTSDRYGPQFTGGGGFERNWDDCSSTPFLRSAMSSQVVTYDDPQSLGMKAGFVREVGMRGMNLFDVGGDADDCVLVDSLRRGHLPWMFFPGLWSTALFFIYCNAQVTWDAQPFNPPSFPLAVRTPYLSTWLPQGKGAALNNAWPTFWNGQITGWAGFVKVDGAAFSFLGAPAIPVPFAKAKQKSAKFTSTQSIFVLSAGAVDLTVTFLSPVEPDDFSKQSLPFSYMAISAASTDGKAHNVQIYSDISAEWVSGDTKQLVTWNTTVGSTIHHEIALQKPVVFGEVNDRIQHGSAFYSTTAATGVTYQSGADSDVRSRFVNNGSLTNTLDTTFRAIGDRWVVFAFAHDLGQVTQATRPVVVAVGHARDPAVKYIVANGKIQQRSVLFWSRFSDVKDAITSFLQDYSAALARATLLDTQVQKDAAAISNDYAGIVALSIRQAMATMEITASRSADGSFNTSDILIFMKEISSNGNMNTVDVIYPTLPLLLYFNPLLAKGLTDVIFRYEATGQYPNKYSVHDIGAAYPNALGHNDGKDSVMPVEECGNMLIMALAYAQEMSDNSQLKEHFDLLDQWAQYLVAEALVPASQLSTDDFAGPLANQTNLAIKGIIGIKAMSRIAAILGKDQLSSNYSSTASSYLEQWQRLATNADSSHLTLSYGDNGSFGLAYNLYADKLLGLDFIPNSVYQMQTSWYRSVLLPFGVQLDTRHTYTKSDWQIWTAATVTDTNTRDMFISSIRHTLASGLSSNPLGDWYDAQSGAPQIFKARPVVGGHLAFLIVSTTNNTIPDASASSTGSGDTAATQTGTPTDPGTGTSTIDQPTTETGAARSLISTHSFIWLALLTISLVQSLVL
ncbi:MPN domain-containing protein [Mycena kentingensis (nom. inval.)]|nr:MPN domain-containing protein [Mycena kentingensis (nom. inval.)]